MNAKQMQVISTKTHGILDFLTVGFALAFPRVLGCSKEFTNAVTMIAVGKLGYALMTKHELGVAKVIPMKAHLAMDAVGGATLAALPYLLDERDEAAMATCVALGLMDMSASVMTETQPRDDSMIPDVGQKVRRSLKRTTRSARQMAGA